jgi:hypothetical protein
MGPKDMGHGPDFVRAGDEKTDFARCGEGRRGQSEPGNQRRLPGTPNDDYGPSSLPQCGGMREQGGRVSVRADAQEHDVEPRLALGRSRDRSELAGVASRGLGLRAELASKAVNAMAGHRDPGQERFPCRAEIAVGVFGSHTPLVAEEHLRLPPRKAPPILPGKESVETLRSAAARDHPGECSTIPHAFACSVDEVSGQRRAGGREVGVDAHPALYAGFHRCPHCSARAWASFGPQESAG